MKKQNQSERTITKFVDINGIGTVASGNGYKDVYIYGFFKKFYWWFIVHRDIRDPRYFMVSEASTGYRLKDENYYTIEDALYFANSFIEDKQYYLSTRIDSILVKTQCNLLKRNINPHTLALDTLWL